MAMPSSQYLRRQMRLARQEEAASGKSGKPVILLYDPSGMYLDPVCIPSNSFAKTMTYGYWVPGTIVLLKSEPYYVVNCLGKQYLLGKKTIFYAKANGDIAMLKRMKYDPAAKTQKQHEISMLLKKRSSDDCDWDALT